MSVSDSNLNPDPVPPEALAAGQRTLAAIVFTDTVGFSALMSKNEELTLRLVGRDLDHMKAACGAFGGQVLKSTGDGLLMLFTSAVQAVACALEIQRNIQKQNLELPKAERLRHRIGIHLGDVFQNGNDVMGDGVNIAARLQTEAVPGGICLSKTVYDVVNNRLQFYVNDLGARKLKNIGTVTAYQISPTNDGTSRYRIAWYRWRSLLSAAAVVIVLVLLLTIVFRLGRHREWASAHPGQPGSYTLLPLTSPFAEEPKASSGVTAPLAPVPPEPVSPVPPPVPANISSGNAVEVSDQEFEMTRFDLMRSYDFEGMMDWMAAHDWPGKSTSVLAGQCHDMQHLFRWTQEQLHGYSASNPLVVSDAGGKKTAFWTVSFGGLKMKTDSKTITVVREQIPPAMMERIVLELLAEHSISPADRAHFRQDLAVFSQAYNLPPPAAAATH